MYIIVSMYYFKSILHQRLLILINIDLSTKKLVLGQIFILLPPSSFFEPFPLWRLNQKHFFNRVAQFSAIERGGCRGDKAIIAEKILGFRLYNWEFFDLKKLLTRFHWDFFLEILKSLSKHFCYCLYLK